MRLGSVIKRLGPHRLSHTITSVPLPIWYRYILGHMFHTLRGMQESSQGVRDSVNLRKRSLHRLLAYLVSISLSLQGIACSRPKQSTQNRTLEEALLAESPSTLSQAARTLGDPKRGAIVFHSDLLACSKCHPTGQQSASGVERGPDLTQYDVRPSDEDVVLAVLKPSAFIRKGWESVVIATGDGRTLTGLIVSETENAIFIYEAQTGQVTKIHRVNIDERKTSEVSIMPPGQVNLLEDRQAFLDLISYLIAIRDGGKARADELQPAAE